MSMTFTKLFSSITASTIWSAPDHTRIVWITMLAMADQHGRVWASIPGLANIARVPIESAEAALNELMAPDKYSRTKDNEGRRIEEIDGGWRLLNHAKYRAIRDEESIKQSKRNYINNRRAEERMSKAVEECRTESNDVALSRANTEAEAYTEAVEKKEKARKRAPSPKKPDDVSDQVWTDWLQLRREKRAPVTQTVVDGVIREAGKAGMTVEAFLSVWCRRGSQGLEAAWLRPDERGQSVESFRERDARQAALKVKAWTGGLCHDRKALGEDRTPLPFERGYVKPADTIEGEAHEQHRIAG